MADGMDTLTTPDGQFSRESNDDNCEWPMEHPLTVDDNAITSAFQCSPCMPGLLWSPGDPGPCCKGTKIAANRWQRSVGYEMNAMGQPGKGCPQVAKNGTLFLHRPVNKPSNWTVCDKHGNALWELVRDKPAPAMPNTADERKNMSGETQLQRVRARFQGRLQQPDKPKHQSSDRSRGQSRVAASGHQSQQGSVAVDGSGTTAAKPVNYKGECVNGTPHGKGTRTYLDGGKYDGEWQNGEFHGNGTATYKNGNKYEGDWKNGKHHGTGTFTHKSGNKYEGDWQNGTPHGKGTKTRLDGVKLYDGDWQSGRFHGKGTATYNNGKYDGEWQNGSPHGKGTATYNNGDKYEGDWKNGKHHGTGTFTYKNGDKYEGVWQDGKWLAPQDRHVRSRPPSSLPKTKKRTASATLDERPARRQAVQSNTLDDRTGIERSGGRNSATEALARAGLGAYASQPGVTNADVAEFLLEEYHRLTGADPVQSSDGTSDGTSNGTNNGINNGINNGTLIDPPSDAPDGPGEWL